MNTDRFKFRVWCKNKNEWEKDDLILESDSNLFSREQCLYYTHENHIVELCIGIKDANGNLIYEGDIVDIIIHCGNGVFFERDNCIILFKDSNFVVETIDKGNFNPSDIDVELFLKGNIHENPELLETYND